MKNELSNYINLVGKGPVDDIRTLAEELGTVKIQNINSTRQGGGVAELLYSTVPLLTNLGFEVEWDVIEGNQDFFEITKKIHNALHGVITPISENMINKYVNVVEKNENILKEDIDFTIVHDPQPLPLITKRMADRCKWIWRCHIDVSKGDKELIGYLRQFIDKYYCSVYHLPIYSLGSYHDEYFFTPAIDPFTDKNRELTESQVNEELEKYQIDPEIPMILQVSRFDMLKDPLGVIKAFKMVQEKGISAQLVMAGGEAADDPEGGKVLENVIKKAEKSRCIHILTSPSDISVNALQRASSVVVQKSIREGFGLVVTEAMFKGKAVVGGNVGGIRKQITDGKNGFLVNTVEDTAYRIQQLLTDPGLAENLGREAGKTVVKHYLMPNLVKNWITLFLSLKYGKNIEEKLNINIQ